MENNNIFPCDWKNIIEGKKVILYNTSVGSLLQGKEKHIEKMKWVFRFFKKKTEVVLWWRPHPLELSTIESMHPELRKAYIEAREQFRMDKVGVLDESADVNRALAISDAYYGDWSSLVQLYKQTQKPILIAKDYVHTKQQAEFLPITFCIREDSIWFIQLNSNKLIKLNKDTYNVEYVWNIPAEIPYKNRLYNYHIFNKENRLIILLNGSENIYEFNVDTSVFQIISLKKNIFSSQVVLKKHNRIIMFPYLSNQIEEYCIEFQSLIETKRVDRKEIKAAGCYENINDYIYMVREDSNIIYCYGIKNKTFIEKKIGDSSKKYWGIKKIGKYYVLPESDKERIILWNEETGDIVELADFPNEYTSLPNKAYLAMFEYDGQAYIIPFYANMILKIDIVQKKVSQVFKETEYDMNLDGPMFLCARQYGDSIYAYSVYKHCWEIFNMRDMTVQDYYMSEAKNSKYRETLEKILDDTMTGETFCGEESPLICNLENYVEGVASRSNKVVEKAKLHIGVNIHKAVINE